MVLRILQDVKSPVSVKSSFRTFDAILNTGITHNETNAALRWNRVNQSPSKLVDGCTIFCLNLDCNC